LYSDDRHPKSLPPSSLGLSSQDSHCKTIWKNAFFANGARELHPKIVRDVLGLWFTAVGAHRIRETLERNWILAAMPILPADFTDPRYVAAADQIKQQIVALHQAPDAARVVHRCEPPVAAFVLVQLDAGQRNAVAQVRSRAFIDLTQGTALEIHRE